MIYCALTTNHSACMSFDSAVVISLFFLNDAATTEIYTLSLHDALPIYISRTFTFRNSKQVWNGIPIMSSNMDTTGTIEIARSEEHTSELQSRLHLVCRLLLEKKKILFG